MTHLDQAFSEATRIQKQKTALLRRYHSITLPGFGYQQGLVPEDALQNRIDAFAAASLIPGRTVLDFGTASGWNAFWAERNGASKVCAVDYVLYHDFVENHKCLASKVQYFIGDIHDSELARIGIHDIVFCFGVLYHCRHPLLALERIAALTGEVALIESFVTDEIISGEHSTGHRKLMEFYESTELGGQLDNWYGPTSACLLSMIRSAGFARVQQIYLADRRIGIIAHKNPIFPSPPHPSKIELTGAVSNLTRSRTFEAMREEYIEAYFQHVSHEVETLYLKFESFCIASIVVDIKSNGEGQAIFRLPSWVLPGKHTFTLCLEDGQCSNAVEIDVRPPKGMTLVDLHEASLRLAKPLTSVRLDSPLVLEAVEIYPCQVHTSPPELVISVFIGPTHYSPAEFWFTVDGFWGIPTTYVATAPEGRTQLQFRVPMEFVGLHARLIAPSIGRQSEAFVLKTNN